MQDPVWAEKEAERQRKKEQKRYYTKLKGTEEYNAKSRVNRAKWLSKYPEKRKAHTEASNLPCKKGNHNHHWSYRPEHTKDVIEISMQDHYYIHRYMKYRPDMLMYETLDGVLLDSRDKHIEFIERVLKLRL
jgi:hypothetical protein